MYKGFITCGNNMFGGEIRENGEFQRAKIAESIKEIHKYFYEHGIVYENVFLESFDPSNSKHL